MRMFLETRQIPALALVLMALLVPIATTSQIAHAQTAPAAAPAKPVVGTVSKIDLGNASLVVKTDQGEEVTINIASSTRRYKMPVGETDMKKATTLDLGEVTIGDRALASGAMSADQKILTARTLVVTVKAELAAKAKAEADDWQKRGSMGLVSIADPATNSFKLKKRDAEGKLVEVTVKPAAKVDVKRYRDDSIKFSDAVSAQFADVQKGDQVRVLGDTGDGAIAAERVIFGRFRTIAGRVKKVDVATGEITIDDIDSKKPLVISVNADTSMRKMSTMVDRMLAMQANPSLKSMMETMGANGQRGGARAGGAAGGGAAAPTAPSGGAMASSPSAPAAKPGAAPGEGAGRPANGAGMGGMMGGAAMSPQQIASALERQPKIELAQIVEGESVIITGAFSKEPGRMKAVSLMAGAELTLTALPDVGGVSTGLGQAGMAGAL